MQAITSKPEKKLLLNSSTTKLALHNSKMRSKSTTNLMAAKGSCPIAVKRRGMCMVSYLRAYGILDYFRVDLRGIPIRRRLDTVHPNRYSSGSKRIVV